MFQIGQKVVCINDSFPKPKVQEYFMLPKQGVTYTIRAVYVGRGVRAPLSSASAGNGEVGVLLAELKNPLDPRCKNFQELGFNAERFAAVTNQEEEQAEQQPQEAVA